MLKHKIKSSEKNLWEMYFVFIKFRSKVAMSPFNMGLFLLENITVRQNVQLLNFRSNLFYSNDDDHHKC